MDKPSLPVGLVEGFLFARLVESLWYREGFEITMCVGLMVLVALCNRKRVEEILSNLFW